MMGCCAGVVKRLKRGGMSKRTKQRKLPQRGKFALELLYAGEQSELISRISHFGHLKRKAA